MGDELDNNASNATGNSGNASSPKSVAAPDGTDGGTLPTTPPVARGAQAVNALAPPGHTPYPTLPYTPFLNQNIGMEAKDYRLAITGLMPYVKGWLNNIIQLGDTVPADTGGVLNLDFSDYGGGWRFSKPSERSPTGRVFWNGLQWVMVPTAWDDSSHGKLHPLGVWREGNVNRAQYGQVWPEDIPPWPDATEAMCGSVLRTWAADIAGVWSHKWDLKRQDCTSPDEYCCRYRPAVSVDFRYIPTSMSVTIILAGNEARSNEHTWSLKEASRRMPPHEFGHHLDNPDEYVGGVGVDPNVNDDGATAGIDPTSIMGGGDLATVVKRRHLRLVCQQLSLMIGTASANPMSYVLMVVPTLP